MRQLYLCLSLCLAVAGCADELGDPCDNSADCSPTADRTCDIAQPGGYCTIEGCEGGGCPDEGRCVQFDPDEPRLSSTWCMASCSDNGDCRALYACRSAEQLGLFGVEAVVLDKGESKGKFCVSEPERSGLGGECLSSFDCSVLDGLSCDVTQPGGYCTLVYFISGKLFVRGIAAGAVKG